MSDKERIEKEAQRYVMEENGYQFLPEHFNWKKAYIAGATSEHTKAWNAAIDAVINLIEENPGFFKSQIRELKK